MKKLFFLLFLLPLVANADNYQLSFSWTDSTVYQPDEIPSYEYKYNINGVETVGDALPTPSGTEMIVADPGTPIQVSVRNCNDTWCSDWSPWVTATAPYAPTVPDAPANLTITITRVP